MSDPGRNSETSLSGDPAASTRRSNLPLVLIFGLAAIILLGAFIYAFMMTIPGSMPGMAH
jgi:hypothetical protein